MVFMGISILTACASGSKNGERDVTNSSRVTTDKKSKISDTSSSTTSTTSNSPLSDKSDTNAVSSEAQNEASVESTTNTSSLSNYTNDQIEYARVWLAYGANQNIDELDVLEIPAGTLINPNDKTSSVYTKKTIQLSGSRLVDGVVTYSSNGNGTINLYNVPKRWDSVDTKSLEKNYMKNYTQSLIDNAKVANIPTGDEVSVEKLIKMQIIH